MASTNENTPGRLANDSLNSLPINLPADPTASINSSAFPTIPPPESSPESMATLEGRSGSAPPSPIPHSRAEAPYELIRVIGQGGQGVVWEAVQTALGRVIAVKSIRGDLVARVQDDAQMASGLMKSFRQEALTTGGLEHPNIVPVYDLGEDAEGRPLMAMKIVRGKPWDKVIASDIGLDFSEFLDKHLLVLAQVVQAVAFAHSRGVIHRDLKPSQVMIGEYGEVLLADWGLAVYIGSEDKAQILDPRSRSELPTRDSSTNPSGTPAFMAPEQTQASGAALGPWTDVFLLGATLFYLLTGTVPHQGTTSAAAFELAQRGIVPPPEERSPDRSIPDELSALCRDAMRPDPKDRIPTAKEFHKRLSDYMTGASRRRESMQLVESAARRMEAGNPNYSALTSILQDLEQARSLWTGNARAAMLHADAIVLYAKAALQNGDLTLAQVQAERLGEGERRSAIMNQIDGARQRSAAHARQRQLAFAGLGLLAIALLIGGLFLRNARRREEEQARLAMVMKRVNQLHADEQALAEELSHDVPLPDSIDSKEYRRLTLDESRVNALLERRGKLQEERAALIAIGAEEIGTEPFPLVLAEANVKFSRAGSTSEFMSVYRLYEQAAKQRPKDPEPLTGMGISVAMAGFPTTATLHLHDATDLTRAGKGEQSPEYATALALEAEANRQVDDSGALYLKQYEESLSVLTPIWANYSLDLADRLRRLGKSAKAVELTSSTLNLIPETTREFKILAATARYEMGQALIDSTGPVQALEMVRLAYQQRKELLGEEDPKTMDAMRTLAFTMSEAGHYADALQWVRDSIELSERVDGVDNPNALAMYSVQAFILIRTGEFEQAEKLTRRVLEARTKSFGADHPDVASSNYDVGIVMLESGRPDEAVGYLQKSLDSYIRAIGPDHMNVGRLHVSLASALNATGRKDLGRQELLKALDISKRTHSEDTTWLAVINHELGVTYDNRPEAEPFFREALRLRKEYLGEEHVFTGYSSDILAGFLIQQDRFAEAQPLLMKALAIYEKQAGMASLDYAVCMNTVSTLLRQEEKWEDASIISMRALEMLEEIAGPDHPESRFARQTLFRIWEGSADLTRERVASGDFVVMCYYEHESFNTRRRINSGAFRGGFVSLFAGTVSLLRDSDPPHTEAARRAMLRAAAYAAVAGPDELQDWREGFLQPGLKAMGLEEEVAKLPPPPDELKAAAEEGCDGKVFRDYLDSIAPAVDLKAEFPGITDWTTARLQPRGEELKRLAGEILARMSRESPPSTDAESKTSATQGANTP